MPRYLKSRARKTFDSEMAGVFRTVRRAFSRRCRLADVRVFVLSNAMVLGSAKLETYVEDLVGDWVARVNAHAFQTNDLPTAVRARFFCQQNVSAAYENFIVKGDEAELHSRIANLLNGPSVRFLIDGQPSPPLNAGWILYECKFPSARNWSHLFRRVGIPNVFHSLNAEAHADVELLLTSFNDLRNALAHQGIPPGLSVDDIRSKLADVIRIVGWLDKVVFRRVGYIGTTNLWTV